MAKLPWFQFYPQDWLRDTAKLSPTAQGQWIKILCYAWNEPERGVYEREETAACYELNEDYMTLKDLLEELQYVADVSSTIKDDDTMIIRIVSRRMVKEEKAREYERNKKRLQRVPALSLPCPDTVPPKKLEVRSQKLDNTLKTITRFQPPALEEMQDYSNEKGWRWDVERCHDYYTANGWKVGKNPMKDWKAVMRNWNKSEFQSKRDSPAMPREVI